MEEKENQWDCFVNVKQTEKTNANHAKHTNVPSDLKIPAIFPEVLIPVNASPLF